MVAGLTNGELIAPMTYEEMVTSDFFEAWFQKFLLPTLTTPSVIIMDNARFHRMGKLELLCEEFGHKLLPLPPYSPEYNPIEKTWAYIKKNLKKYTMWYNLFMAYSIDFRKKVLSYCERTGSITEASHVFQISRNTIYGWLKLKEKTGELNHQVKGTKPRKVDRDRLKNYLTDNPDAYLTEIASDFGCHPTTIHYALKAMGYTRKKEPHLL
ncbi:IS630-Spn1, transposase Orf1 [Streptococcus pneumoniae]|nr:IS630-Spn1, transposase Orf1 [Streptococcus pneumoniae]